MGFQAAVGVELTRFGGALLSTRGGFSEGPWSEGEPVECISGGGLNLSGRSVDDDLDRAICRRASPRTTTSDRWTDFINRALDGWGRRRGVGPVSSGQAGRCGRRTLNRSRASCAAKFLDAYRLRTRDDAKATIETWRHAYQRSRLRPSLGHLTPV